eukprot:TRINITY_DN7305_c0_g1_i1.p1 TRINITY_DN7305_c0_g1~~TRINITY_DN7305_c0_g1_i1.p1  ORF type:complete len:183 (+),score=39.98 TRINITY_DN7305_c0_g1_i1:40-549(+)
MTAYTKLQMKLNHDPNNLFWAEDKKRFGYQQLLKMGWSKGEGLGSKGSGKPEPIKVKKRAERIGIGAENMEEAWITKTKDFDDVLSRMNSSKVPKTEESKSKSKPQISKHFSNATHLKICMRYLEDMNQTLNKSQLRIKPLIKFKMRTKKKQAHLTCTSTLSKKWRRER